MNVRPLGVVPWAPRALSIFPPLLSIIQIRWLLLVHSLSAVIAIQLLSSFCVILISVIIVLFSSQIFNWQLLFIFFIASSSLQGTSLFLFKCSLDFKEPGYNSCLKLLVCNSNNRILLGLASVNCLFLWGLFCFPASLNLKWFWIISWTILSYETLDSVKISWRMDFFFFFFLADNPVSLKPQVLKPLLKAAILTSA